MKEPKRYFLGEKGLEECDELGRLGVYLAADYDQLKAENERLIEEVASLKATGLFEKMGLLDRQNAEHDTLHKQLDEARARAIKIIGWHRNEYNGAQIDHIIQAFNDAWPEANK